MEFYLIQTFTTAARPHFAEALRLVQDTASAEEDSAPHRPLLRGGFRARGAKRLAA